MLLSASPMHISGVHFDGSIRERLSRQTQMQQDAFDDGGLVDATAPRAPWAHNRHGGGFADAGSRDSMLPSLANVRMALMCLRKLCLRKLCLRKLESTSNPMWATADHAAACGADGDWHSACLVSSITVDS
jgi:hypothetical protein